MRTQIEGDWLDPVSTPRLWNFAVATQQDARRNLATETLRLRSAARLGPGSLPAPCAPRACAAACCFRGNRAGREGTASAGAGGGMRPTVAASALQDSGCGADLLQDPPGERSPGLAPRPSPGSSSRWPLPEAS